MTRIIGHSARYALAGSLAAGLGAAAAAAAALVGGAGLPGWLAAAGAAGAAVACAAAGMARAQEDARARRSEAKDRELERQRELIERLSGAYNQLLIEHNAHSQARQLERRRFFADIEAQKSGLISARDAAEAEALSRSRFFASMTHELRTPMNAIMGFSEAIEQQIFGPDRTEKYIEYARDIRLAGQHLLDTINHLLDLAKADAGRLQLSEAPVDIEEICGQSVAMLRRMADTREIVLTVEIEPDMPPYRADAQILRQVLINLLSNAIRFTPPGGDVVLTAAIDRADDLVLQISDTGVGIAPDDLERIFEPFSQGRIKGAGAGTGLGLPLSRTFVHLHGGELSLDSREGQGTTARVHLPSYRWRRDPQSEGPRLVSAQAAGEVQTGGSLAAQSK